MGRLKSYYGLKDARSMQGILSRGHANYGGPGNAPRVGKIFDVQKAARNRLKKVSKFQDMRRVGR
jgi:hypothetical protein